MLSHSILVAKSFCRGDYVAEKEYDPLDMVLFASMHIRIYKQLLARSPLDRLTEAYLRKWRDLWSELQVAVHKYWDTEGWTAAFVKRTLWEDRTLDRDVCLQRDREAVEDCLRVLEELEAGRTDTGKTTDEMSPIFVLPDELVTALGLYVLPTDVSGFPRLARLRTCITSKES